MGRRVGVAMMHVLIIEDDEPTAQAVGEVLELEGFAVRRVRNGADAIDVLHDFTPDVVIVDLQLPVMDGRSFIELYRRRVRPAASVIVMSGRTDGRSIAQSIGADGYVAKPFESAQLLSAISLALAVA
jgi:two-component system response regulator MtrA